MILGDIQHLLLTILVAMAMVLAPNPSGIVGGYVLVADVGDLPLVKWFTSAVTRLGLARGRYFSKASFLVAFAFGSLLFEHRQCNDGLLAGNGFFVLLSRCFVVDKEVHYINLEFP